jgi:DNA-binding transcriptional ArsR family regulator
LAVGELTLVTIPSIEREQLRDLVRCREDIRVDLMRARHRIGKFLLRRETPRIVLPVRRDKRLFTTRTRGIIRRVELRRPRLLHELARRGTIAAVAEGLSYSPSSVSVQLAELEREAGTKLLRRVGRNVELTPAGSRLAAYAKRALDADEAVRAELGRAR